MNKKRFYAIDLAKFILSIMVVLVHCDCIRCYSAIGNLVIREGICRASVPIFFAFSGCLMSLVGWNYTCLSKQLKKIFVLYIKWSLVYFLFKLIFSMVNNNYSNSFYLDELWNTLFIAENYHLWYLLALIYAIILFIVVLKIKDKNIIRKSNNSNNYILYFFVIAFLWIINCLHYTYNWVCQFNNTYLDLIIYKYEGIFNALFYAVPMIMVGRMSAMSYQKHKTISWAVKLILIIILYFTEIFLLFFFIPSVQNYTIYLTTPLLTYFLLCLLMNIRIQLNKKISKFFRDMSLYIYLIHPMIILVWNSYIKRDGIIKFCTVLFLSFFLSLIIYSVKLFVKRDK